MTRRFISALVLALVTSQAYAQICINETRISSPGADDNVNNFVELAGSGSLSGHYLLSISTEFNPGEITFAFDLGAESIPADGFFLASGDDMFYPGLTDFVTATDFFGSPQAFVLVESFTGAQGDDLDADNDGTFDAAVPWASIVDSVVLGDDDGTPDTTYTFGAPVIETGSTFTPAHIFRSGDCGTDFSVGVFGDQSGDTPGATNIVPEPSAFALLLVGLVGIIRRRR